MTHSLLRSALCAPLFAWLAMAGAWADDAPTADSTAASAGGSVENSVVKIFATVSYPNPFSPWTKEPPRDITASGVVIEGDRILTNAHAVVYASDIQVQATKEGDKVPATVAAVAPGIDLAVLKLDDPSFFQKHPPIARAGTLPRIKDAVLVYGFPEGGDSLSITKGIVSRIEFVPYNYPTSGLRIQIDAAINPGNSGGPAIAGNEMIGLAFSRLGGDAENIGYIIPDEEIDLFLRGVASGEYRGKPGLYDQLQTLENPALRTFLKLDPSVTGVVVHQPARADPTYPLKEWDVITHIGDTPIDDQGMIDLAPDVRLSFLYLVQKIARDGKVPLTIVRDGRTRHVEVPVPPERPLLIRQLVGDYPSYFIYGPLVFSTATSIFVGSLNNNARLLSGLAFVRSPLVTERGDAPSPEREELVVISSPFFPSRLADGYSNQAGSVVYSVNGTRIRSLAQLVALLRDLKDDFVVIEFDSRGGEGMVFPRKEMVAATEEILMDNGVRAQGSPDMMAIWQGKAAN